MFEGRSVNGGHAVPRVQCRAEACSGIHVGLEAAGGSPVRLSARRPLKNKVRAWVFIPGRCYPPTSPTMLMTKGLSPRQVAAQGIRRAVVAAVCASAGAGLQAQTLTDAQSLFYNARYKEAADAGAGDPVAGRR